MSGEQKTKKSKRKRILSTGSEWTTLHWVFGWKGGNRCGSWRLDPCQAGSGRHHGPPRSRLASSTQVVSKWSTQSFYLCAFWSVDHQRPARPFWGITEKDASAQPHKAGDTFWQRRGLSCCIIESHYEPRCGGDKLNLSSVFYVARHSHAAEI